MLLKSTVSIDRWTKVETGCVEPRFVVVAIGVVDNPVPVADEHSS